MNKQNQKDQAELRKNTTSENKKSIIIKIRNRK